MAHGEEIRITRTWVNKAGRTTLIKDLTDEELMDGIIRLIKDAVKEEWYEKGGPQKYKNSWQSYVERAYWDFCQAFWVRGIAIEDLINDTSSSTYRKLKEKPPTRREKKKSSSLGLGHFWEEANNTWAHATAPLPLEEAPLQEGEEDIYPPMGEDPWTVAGEPL